MFADRDIVAAVDVDSIDIQPFDRSQLQPASLDVRLGDVFATLPVGQTFTLSDPPPSAHYDFHVGPFELKPGEFVLGCTLEKVRIGPNIVAQLEGKSSIGRLGVLVHVTAGLIDPGFHGEITLELFNLSKNTVVLEPGVSIGQLTFQYLQNIPYHTYRFSGQYNGQRGPTPSKGVR